MYHTIVPYKVLKETRKDDDDNDDDDDEFSVWQAVTFDQEAATTEKLRDHFNKLMK